MSNPGDRWRRGWLLLVAALIAAAALLLARCTVDNNSRNVVGTSAEVIQITPPASATEVPTDGGATVSPVTEPVETAPPITEPRTTVAPAATTTTTTLPPDAAETVQAIAEAIELEGIEFVIGSAELTPAATSTLDKVADTLNANPEVKVEIGGHTDNTGVAASNLKLSQQRAEAVLAHLVTKSVDAARLTAVGYGQDRPIDDNTTDAGRARNRRIEFTPA